MGRSDCSKVIFPSTMEKSSQPQPSTSRYTEPATSDSETAKTGKQSNLFELTMLFYLKLILLS